jgi:hypothetical protein
LKINSNYPNTQLAEQPKVCIWPCLLRASSLHFHNHHLSTWSNYTQCKILRQSTSRDIPSKPRFYFRLSLYSQPLEPFRDWDILVQLDHLSNPINPRLLAILLYISSYPSTAGHNLAPPEFTTPHTHFSNNFTSLTSSPHSAHS